MAIKLPLFQDTAELVTEKRTPTFLFHRWWQSVVESIETAFNRLEQLVIDIQAALDAADIAVKAAEDAQTAANTAQAAADGAGEVAKLSNSGVDGLTLSATDAGTDVTVTISDHIRVYADSTQVSVTGDTIISLAYETTYYIYYSDPEFDGGIVTYAATTIKTDATQTGTRHLVGIITTPAAAEAGTDGIGPSLPGFESF